jgi:exonuclease III
MRRTRPCPAPSGSLVRWLDIDLPDHGFGIAILHTTAAGSSKSHPTNVAKVRFWDAMLQTAESRLQEPFLFVGDWNTGARRQDETGKTFVCAEHFGTLATIGWIGTWRHHNPGATEYTWFSKLKGGVRGNGFRLVYAFATPSLMPRIRFCRYSHVDREAGMPDHSVVIVEIAWGADDNRGPRLGPFLCFGRPRNLVAYPTLTVRTGYLIFDLQWLTHSGS